MPTVRVINNNVDKALKKLKRKMMDEGILQEVRRREYYEKPSDKRNRKRSSAIMRSKKNAGS